MMMNNRNWAGFLLAGILVIACSSPRKDDTLKLRILWKDDRAAALSISGDLLNLDPSTTDLVDVRLVRNVPQPPIFGTLKVLEHEIIFEPLVPFTRGLEYVVSLSGKEIGHIKISASPSSPTVLFVYPQSDTVPFNLLKVYIEFSHPMREGESAKKIAWFNSVGDTLKDVALNLQPELWNRERTQLTLWLHPGRIKRDLQPNRLLGAPLKMGERFTMRIDSSWEDQLGKSLTTGFTKHLFVVARDSLSPSSRSWRITVPSRETRQALKIDFREPLDHVLLMECVKILDGHFQNVEGKVEISNGDRTFNIVPDKSWASGRYTAAIESRLEDLAGNNLVRPFERDLNQPLPKTKETGFIELKITIP